MYLKSQIETRESECQEFESQLVKIRDRVFEIKNGADLQSGKRKKIKQLEKELDWKGNADLEITMEVLANYLVGSTAIKDEQIDAGLYEKDGITKTEKLLDSEAAEKFRVAESVRIKQESESINL